MRLTRRRFLTTSTAAIAGASVMRAPVWGQQAPPVTSFTDLRGGDGMFSGNGGTIGYLLVSDGAVAVDSQFSDTAAIAVAGLKERAPKGIEMLVNTHHHGNHSGGNQIFRGAVKQIVAHENCLAWHRRVAEQAGTAAGQALRTRRSGTRGRPSSGARPYTPGTAVPVTPAAMP